MFLDARKLPPGTQIETDVCVVGAGAAGITLALEFADGPFRVCLVESGGLGFEKSTQDLYRGDSVGLPYFALRQARMAGFGGSTGVWAGWCRPLDGIDLEARDWVPHSGWPFDSAHLDPFYARAHPLCQLGPYVYAPEAWETERARRLPLETPQLTTSVFQISPPTRFGDLYRHRIERSNNIQTLLHANVLELEATDFRAGVTRVRAATLDGKTFSIAAKLFILAAGGLENPRLLLLSDGGGRTALGNEHGLVGRFFGEHPYIDSGSFILSDPRLQLGFYYPRRIGGTDATRVRGVFSLAEATLRREKLVNCSILFRPKHESHAAYRAPGVEALRQLWEIWRSKDVPTGLARLVRGMLSDIDKVAVSAYRRAFVGDDEPVDHVRVRTCVESVPNPESRVTLTGERDRLGRRAIRLDWKLDGLEMKSIRRAHELLDAGLRGAGLGRLEVNLEPGASGWPPSMVAGRHHMGTTRMHRDPRQGVVDEHGRVHGLSNLFVTGSSVFPSTGYVNPTLTIVALALRLADHVKRVMASLPEAVEIGSAPQSRGR
ncbi:MAG TPA: GMC family oxidoreductase [Gemmatimonadota bacterium]